LQRKAYPNLAPVTAAMPVASAFDAALKAAKAMPGWTIVAVDADAGRIDASQQSRWFRFTDDIVIRIAGTEAGKPDRPALLQPPGAERLRRQCRAHPRLHGCVAQTAGLILREFREPACPRPRTFRPLLLMPRRT
jgi:hypothetical protein